MSRSWNENQKRVIDWRNSNILVSAAAGSGKTAALIERIIKMVVEDRIDINRIIVVTFTRAAAAEIKERLAKALMKTLEEAEDKRYIENQISLIQTMQACTIDSFCQFIIRNYFYVLEDFDPSFKVLDNEEGIMLLSEAADQVLEEAYEKDLGRKDSYVIGLSDFFSGWKNDEAFKDLLINIYKKSLTYTNPKQWIYDLLAIYDTMAEDFSSRWERLLDDFVDDMERRLELGKEILYQAKACIADRADTGKWLDILEEDIKRITKPDTSLEHPYETYARLFLDLYAPSHKESGNTWGTWARNMLSKKEKESGDSEALCRVEAIAEAKLYRDKAKKYLEEIYEDYYHINTLIYSLEEGDREFSYMEYIHSRLEKMYPYLKCLMDLVFNLDTAFKKAKKKENALDFNDMEHLALRVLRKEDGSITEIAKELSMYYRQIMVDEYQDSNDLQEAILSAIAGISHPHTDIDKDMAREPYMFMVGDIKQSIYGFRAARPGLFMHKYENYQREDVFEDAESEIRKDHNISIVLDKNYRSRDTVLQLTNRIFRNLMKRDFGGVDYDQRASLKYGELYGAFEPSDTSYYTEVLLIDRGSKSKMSSDELEAHTVGMRIRELVGENALYIRDEKEGMRKARLKDIVILLRSTSAMDVYKKVLANLQIPLIAEGKKGYFDTQEIEIILNYLRLIDNPLQNIAMVSVLRSNFVLLDEREIALLSKSSVKEYFFDKIQDALLTEDIAEQLKQKLSVFMDTLTRYRDRARQHSAYDILYDLYYKEGYYYLVSALKDGDTRKVNLDVLLKKAKEYSDKKSSLCTDFIQYIENLRSSQIDYGEESNYGENDDAVRIMTIHKSKGLEFPVVFLGNINKKFNASDYTGKLVISDGYGIGMNDFDIENRLVSNWQYKRFLSSKIERDIKAEEQRVLYVALTRAKEKLILVGQTKFKKDKKSGQIVNDWSAYELSSKLNRKDSDSMDSYYDWIMSALIQDEAIMELQNRYKEAVEMQEEPEYSLRLASDITKAKEAGDVYMQILSASYVEAIKDNLYLKQETDKRAAYEQDTKLIELLKEQLQYTYPYFNDAGFPSKLSVSALKTKTIDTKLYRLEEEGGYPAYEKEKEILPRPRSLPKFLKEQQRISATDIGNAFHKIVEKLDFGRLEEYQGEEGMLLLIEQLFQRRLIDEHQRAVLQQQCDTLLRFVNNQELAVLDRISKASKEQRLYKEQAFIKEYYADALEEIYPVQAKGQIYEEYKTLVQGIIDSYFIDEDGQIVLIDYKTDGIRKKEMSQQSLKEKYRTQFKYYKEVIESLSGRKVKEEYIYSFALGCFIDMKG